MLAPPEQRPDATSARPLLASSRFTASSSALAGVDAAARRRPPGRELVREADEQRLARRHRAERSAPRRGSELRGAPASSWNQRSRSRHGTAAFAGEVDGRTKSRVSRASFLHAELGRSPNAPRYASLPTKPIQRGPKLARELLEPHGRAAKSPRRRSPEPGVVRYAAFVTPIPSVEQLELLGRRVGAST